MIGRKARYLVVPLLLLCNFAFAHNASTAFLYWNMDDSYGRLDVAIVDLQHLALLDSNADRKILWREISDASEKLESSLDSAVTLSNDGEDCLLQIQLLGLTSHLDENYAAFSVTPDCIPDQLDYRLLSDRDSLHKALVSISDGSQQRLTLLGANQPRLDLSIGDGSTFSRIYSFLWQGMLHLWFGYDHMLFLLTLILAAIGFGGQRERAPLPELMRDLAWIVTAFTVGHSLTLMVAALGWWQPPLRLVEALIALSVSIAALNVLYPFMGQHIHRLALMFGLIHGFGFASVLGDLLGDSGVPLLELISFNVGLELAQLSVVLVLLPLLWRLAVRPAWQLWMVPLACTGILVTGLVWTIERAL